MNSPIHPNWHSIFAVPIFEGLQPIPEQWSGEAPIRASAVLCLMLLPADKGLPLKILFTKRSERVNSHRGQIGFPGGRREPGDLGPVETALRETYEEVGIPPEAVTVLGALPTVKSLDLHPVIPIVGVSRVSLADCHCNPEEVAEAFALPWTSFTAAQGQIIRFNIFGRWRETIAYRAEGYVIWGLTAQMLSRGAIVAPAEN